MKIHQCVKRILILSGIVIYALLSSCRSDKEDMGWKNQTFRSDEELFTSAKDSVEFILLKSMQYNTRFETFATDLDIGIKSQEGKNLMSLNGQLRVEKDKNLWLSISKFFFEIGRMKMNPDSMISYSKLANSAMIYTADGMKNIVEDTSILPTVFRFVQNLLMQQTDTLVIGKCSLNDETGNLWILEGSEHDSLAWSLAIGKEDFRLKEGVLSVIQNGSTLQLRIRYLPDAGGFDMEVALDGKSMAVATVKYTKPRWDIPLRFPMSFPKGTKVSVNSGFVKTMDTTLDMTY